MNGESTRKAEVLSTETRALFHAAVDRAAALLRGGRIVALPTETVYGLAANARWSEAVARIYEAKERPAHNPIIVHVCSVVMAKACVSDWPPLADALAKAFWPGPLTMVLPKSDDIPGNVTAGGSTVGIRWPSHPFIQAVIRECGFPLAAPSANRSTHISPTNASHVQTALGDRVPLIVDGGPSQVGIESTVVDLTSSPPRLLRPGMIHEESLLTVTGELRVGPGPGEERLQSPGLLEKHYAPHARLFMLSWTDGIELLNRLARAGVVPEETHLIVHSVIPAGPAWGRVSVIPHDAEAFARAIYAELHRCDNLGAKWIVVEDLPDAPEWKAIADRLHRAAS